MEAKERYIQHCKREIEVNKHYINVLQEIYNLIDEKWDGKVLNKRLTTYLNKNIDTTHIYNVQLEIENWRTPYLRIYVKQNEREVYSEDGKEFAGYIESSNHTTNISVDNDWRIVLDKTKKFICDDIQLLERINNELNNIITNVDEYMRGLLKNIGIQSLIGLH